MNYVDLSLEYLVASKLSISILNLILAKLVSIQNGKKSYNQRWHSIFSGTLNQSDMATYGQSTIK